METSGVRIVRCTCIEAGYFQERQNSKLDRVERAQGKLDREQERLDWEKE
jgi:hypothetical protein